MNNVGGLDVVLKGFTEVFKRLFCCDLGRIKKTWIVFVPPNTLVGRFSDSGADVVWSCQLSEQKVTNY